MEMNISWIILFSILLCTSLELPWEDRIIPIKGMMMHTKESLAILPDNVIVVRSIEQNSDGTYEWMIMDTGFKSQYDAIDNFFKNNSYGIRYDDVTHILLSHAHVDHASNMKRLKDSTKAKIIVTDYENEFLIKGLNSDYKARGAFFKLTLYQWVHYAAGESYEACETSGKEDMIIPLEELKKKDFMIPEFGARVLWSPGHTKGSISVFFEDINFLFAGDAIIESAYNSEEPVLEILDWIESYDDMNYTINERFEFLKFDNCICIHCMKVYSRRIFNESFHGKSWKD